MSSPVEDTLVNALDELAQAAILLDVENVGGFRALAKKVEAFAELVEQKGKTEPARLMRAVCKRMNAVKKNDVEKRIEVIGGLGQAISIIQRVMEDPERKDAGQKSEGTPDQPGIRAAKKAIAPDAKTSGDENPLSARPDSRAGRGIIDDGLLKMFTDEALEHLDSVEANLLKLETSPQDQESLNAVFRAFHTIKGNTAMLKLEEMESLSHVTEELLDKARKQGRGLEGESLDVTFEVVDALRTLLLQLRDSLEQGTGIPQFGGVTGGLRQKLQNITTFGTSENGGAKASETIGQEKDGLGQNKGGRRKGETIRVDATRFDHLLDTIGELVIAESMVSHSAEFRNTQSRGVSSHMSRLDKITRELQDIATSLRVVPVRAVFQKMARLVRDQAKKSGKKLEFQITGEDTEVDKSIVEVISDPLIHLLRNAVDHGLEDNSEERKKAGKSETALIQLRAYHREGHIYVEVEDDGKGLNRELIVKKAIKSKIIRSSDRLDDRQVNDLIFEPGFSTAETVTETSGRGVGLDVVRRDIESLGGHIVVQTKAGKGTLFSLRLPLTLAIIDGIVIRVGRDQYILPTGAILRSVRPTPGSVSGVLNKGEVFSAEAGLVPMFRLHRLFNAQDAEKDPVKAIIVLVESGARRAGFLIDELLGKQQVVIKSLGDVVRGIRGISGSAIMPDGRVGLILDVDGLIDLAHQDQHQNSEDATWHPKEEEHRKDNTLLATGGGSR